MKDIIKKRVLVTGGAGFLGSYLCEKLLSEGCDVICMDNFTKNVKVRKIATCRHIFHDKYLMKWIASQQATDDQKCPMCNTELFPEARVKNIG